MPGESDKLKYIRANLRKAVAKNDAKAYGLWFDSAVRYAGGIGQEFDETLEFLARDDDIIPAQPISIQSNPSNPIPEEVRQDLLNMEREFAKLVRWEDYLAASELLKMIGCIRTEFQPASR